MIKEPYIKIKTLDYSVLGSTLPDSLNVGMVINSDTGPTGITKISNVTELIKYYSTKQQLMITDDTTMKHAAKLLQFTPIYLTRAFDNSVICGITDSGDKIYTDLEYNHLPYSLPVTVEFNKEATEADSYRATIVGYKGGSDQFDYTLTKAGLKNELAQVNSAIKSNSGTNFFFKSAPTGEVQEMLGEGVKVTGYSFGKVSANYSTDWSAIVFKDYLSDDNNEGSSDTVDMNAEVNKADYITINGYSFYPEWDDGQANNNIYPNISVAVDIPGDATHKGKLYDFKFGLLDKLISGDYGVNEAYGFIDGTGLVESSGYEFEVEDGSYGAEYIDASVSKKLSIYPNSINYSIVTDGRLKITATNGNDTKVFTLPYDSKVENAVDTSEVSSMYGLILLMEQELGDITIRLSTYNNKIYYKTTDILTYNTQAPFVESSPKELDNCIQSLLPSADSVESEDTIKSCWIRIGDYLFYNINISDRSVRNNPDLEQIKISSVELTYKQFLTRLRKYVGDVFNSTNTPNGFTLYWRDMPDPTEFGSSKELIVKWNGSVLVDGGATAVATTENNVITGVTVTPGEGFYNTPPAIVISGGDGKAVVTASLENTLNEEGQITEQNIITEVIDGGSSYYDPVEVNVVPAVNIVDSTPVVSKARFALIARFPSKTNVLQFKYIRQDIEFEGGDPELYTLKIYYKGNEYEDFTISFVENKVDGYNRSVYFDYINNLNDFLQIIPLEGKIAYKEYTSPLFGSEVPVVDPEVDDYISAVKRFTIKDGTYYDFIFDGGYVNAAYAKNIMEICKGGNEDSLWAQAILSPIDTKSYKNRIAYREATGIDNCNAEMKSDWIQDSTIADFLVDISSGALVLERIFANRAGAKEFAPLFGPTNCSFQYKAKYEIINKDTREILLNKQLPCLIYDKSRGVSYFNLDLTLQTLDSSMSDANNCRMVNCAAHIADNLMKDYWGQFNTEDLRMEVTERLTSQIKARIVDNQLYAPADILVVCNESNNPVSVVENRQLVVDVKFKFYPGIRYVHVFNRIYRLSQDFDAIG